jgi:thioredoxin-like negative regulator of GroEL
MIEETTSYKVMEIIEGDRPFMVFFKSEFCEYCVMLSTVLNILNNKYSAYLDFYTLDVNDESAAADVFEEHVQGVPSVILFHAGKFVVVPEPEEPDPIMWYKLSYLENFINQFFRSENEAGTDL